MSVRFVGATNRVRMGNFCLVTASMVVIASSDTLNMKNLRLFLDSEVF